MSSMLLRALARLVVFYSHFPSVLARIGGASFWSFFECDRSCGLTGMGGHGISNVSGKRKRA
jgi:hypothetical protein